MTEFAIETKDLVKSFKGRSALTDWIYAFRLKASLDSSAEMERKNDNDQCHGAA